MNAGSAAEQVSRRRSGLVPVPATSARRGAARPAPERNPALAHLSLNALRDYRVALTAEEAKAGYWRRVVQARLEVVAAASDDVPVVDNLADVMAGVPAQSTRAALLAVVGEDEDALPDLPDLAGIWLTEPRRGDPDANAALTAALEDAERRLADYRDRIAVRLEAATAELIARYRDDPAACLVALPIQPRAVAEA